MFILLLPIVTTRIYASDEIQYFAFLRSLWFDHDLSFDNEYRALVARGAAARSGFVETNLELTTPTGLRPNFGTIGSALLWAPFYAAADLAARGLNGAGWQIPIDGYSTPYVAAVCLGSAFYGLAALLLSLSIATTVVGRGTLAVVTVWFGTPLFFYMYIAPVFAHAASAFAVSLFVFVWLRVRRTWSPRGLAALGAAAALVAMVREQDAFLVVGPALDLLRALRRRPGRQDPAPGPLGLLLAAVAGAVVYLPQVWAYLVLNGRIGPSELVSRKMSWHAPHALEVLVSTSHGFLFWTPVALLAIAGLIVLALRKAPNVTTPSLDAPWIGICALAMVASQVYVAGSVDSWTVAGSFGQRRFVALTPLLVLGLAVLFAVARPRPAWRWTAAAAAVLGVWWNLGLVAQFGMHTMDRQRLTLKDNAWRTFVELPFQGPAVAFRYLTDRASFYGPKRP